MGTIRESIQVFDTPMHSKILLDDIKETICIREGTDLNTCSYDQYDWRFEIPLGFGATIGMMLKNNGVNL